MTCAVPTTVYAGMGAIVALPTALAPYTPPPPPEDPAALEAIGADSRFALVGAGLTIIYLGGCSEPRPAPRAHEDQIPANQIGTASHGQQAVLDDMLRVRAEGHHTDQTLFFVLGAALFFSAVGNVVQFVRNRRMKSRLAQAENPTPPPSPPATTKTSVAPRIGE